MKVRWPRRLCRKKGAMWETDPEKTLSALKIVLRGWEEAVRPVKDRRDVAPGYGAVAGNTKCRLKHSDHF